MLPNPIENDLASRLKDPDPEVRRVAVMELPYSDEDDILPLLLEAAHDSDGTTCPRARW